MQVNLTVNVDETLFNDELKSQLEALKPEEVKEVLLKCIYEYFSKDNYANIEKLLITKSDWNRSNIPTRFTEKIIEACDYSALQEIVDKSIEIMKNKYDIILKDTLSDVLLKGMTDNYFFKSSLQRTIQEQIIIRENDLRMQNKV